MTSIDDGLDSTFYCLASTTSTVTVFLLKRSLECKITVNMSWENANDPPSKDEESSTPGIADVADYDLNSRVVPVGLRAGLTSYGDQHFSLFLRKAFIKALGYSSDALSRSIVGVTNTYSGFNPCHGNVPQLMEAVKRGVLLEGGLGVDFPTITLHESFASPTSMLYRNLMSMDTEEAVNGLPADAWVGIGGQLS